MRPQLSQARAISLCRQHRRVCVVTTWKQRKSLFIPYVAHYRDIINTDGVTALTRAHLSKVKAEQNSRGVTCAFVQIRNNSCNNSASLLGLFASRWMGALRAGRGGCCEPMCHTRSASQLPSFSHAFADECLCNPAHVSPSSAQLGVSGGCLVLNRAGDFFFSSSSRTRDCVTKLIRGLHVHFQNNKVSNTMFFL